MSVEIKTFGCRLNHYESEVMKTKIEDSGLQNAIVINSCAVTNEAERQLRQFIRHTKKENPDRSIILTGCAGQIDPQKYSSMEQITKVIGNREKMDSSEYSKIAGDIRHGVKSKESVGNIMKSEDDPLHFLRSFDEKTRAFLQIQQGCDHRCTFCTIPYGRGNSKSIPLGHIVKQAEILLESGYKEIVLTGVDITSYGNDLPISITLGQAIKRLFKLLPALPRLRLSSIDVAEIDHHLLDVISNEERFMPHLHLSLQSGNNMILKRMKRRHTSQQVNAFTKLVRTLRPNVAFGADIITGFPTEDNAMFRDSYDIIEQNNIIHTHVFPYSERNNTPAAKMPQVAKSIRRSRARELRMLVNQLLNQHHDKLLHSSVKGLVEGNNVIRMEDFCTAKLNNNGDSEGSGGDGNGNRGGGGNGGNCTNTSIKIGDIINANIVRHEGGTLFFEPQPSLHTVL